MKLLSRPLIIFVLLLAGPAVFAADEAPATPDTPAAPVAPKEKKPETELTKQMDKMNGAFRKLRRQAGDATKNADSIEQVAILREFATASAKLEPAKAAAIPEADRKKWVADYQAKMGDMLKIIDRLDAAFKAGQNEEAVKIVADLGALQKEGHKEYRAEEKK
jgi:soluble cytochrome b562